MLEDLRSSFLEFLKRNRLGNAPQSSFDRFNRAFLDGDEITLTNMAEEYRGFGDYRLFLKATIGSRYFPTHDQMRQMSDAQFCALFERSFAIQGAVCIPECEADLLAYLLQWSKLEAGAVVDVGGGVCHNLSFLKTKGKIPGLCIGIDSSTPIIKIGTEVAYAEGADVRFVKGNCIDLPLPAESVAQIWMVDVLNWVMSWKKALQEASRILIPNGRIILAISCTGANARSDIDTSRAVHYLEELGFQVIDVTMGAQDCIAAEKVAVERRRK